MMGWRLQPHFLAIWIWTRRLASCNLWKQSNCLPLNPLQMKIFRLHSAVPCQAQDERNYFMICKLWLSFLHWAIKATFVFVQLSLPIQFHHSSGNSSILGHLQGMSSLPCDPPTPKMLQSYGTAFLPLLQEMTSSSLFLPSHLSPSCRWKSHWGSGWSLGPLLHWDPPHPAGNILSSSGQSHWATASCCLSSLCVFLALAGRGLLVIRGRRGAWALELAAEPVGGALLIYI